MNLLSRSPTRKKRKTLLKVEIFRPTRPTTPTVWLAPLICDAARRLGVKNQSSSLLELQRTVKVGVRQVLLDRESDRGVVASIEDSLLPLAAAKTRCVKNAPVLSQLLLRRKQAKTRVNTCSLSPRLHLKRFAPGISIGMVEGSNFLR